ncbi:hypothetical protein BDQ17DRAFT_1330014 [Cyathus striatus]|nr:hypothetical protein BDQ17DRAFT_1330014 [Cyathus striatus]
MLELGLPSPRDEMQIVLFDAPLKHPNRGWVGKGSESREERKKIAVTSGAIPNIPFIIYVLHNATKYLVLFHRPKLRIAFRLSATLHRNHRNHVSIYRMVKDSHGSHTDTVRIGLVAWAIDHGANQGNFITAWLGRGFEAQRPPSPFFSTEYNKRYEHKYVMPCA